MKKSYLFTDFLVKIVLVFLVGVFVISICGCAQKERIFLFGKAAPKTEQFSKEEFREALNSFEEFAVAAIAEVARQIEAESPAFRSQKTNMVQTTRVRHAIHAMLEHEDPIVAYIETWGFCVRLTNYLKHGEGSRLYGPAQNLAIAAAEKLQTEVEMIGQRFLKEDVFTETSADIHAFANANPIIGIFSNTIVYATKVEPGKQGLFEDVISIPMSPFKALTGVDRTASAIYGVRDSANRFSDVVEEFPESTRTQLLFLLMEMGETEMVKSLLESMSNFSDSSVRFADTAEELPEKLSTLIGELDEKQANLQVTLEKAEKTSASIEQALVQADKAAISFQAVTNNINQTATAWEKAALATTEALADFKSLKAPPKDKNADTKSDFNLIDFRDTVEVVGQTVSEMGDLTDEVHELVESEQLDKYASMPGKLANLLALRFGQLIFLIFILAIMYRVIIVRFVNKQK